MSTRGKARVFGQDLMRGEHVVGGGTVASRNLTWVQGARSPEALDETSRKNLAAGHKAHTSATDTLMALAGGESPSHQSGTSIFDPVLCELVYRWFCPPQGLVLDPFAGGSVRGIVAAKCGRQYCGIDLSAPQLAANRAQALAICPDALPEWIQGDSRSLATLCQGLEADLLFSCPPYADLERYSDDPADLSTMGYADFLAAYQTIIAQAVVLLKPDRFACFVVGDVRDKHGWYSKLPWYTIEAFEAAGARLYNEAVLLTAIGSLPLRVGKQFVVGRKLGKTHQNVLIFCKGDPRRATEACGPVTLDALDESIE